MFAIAGQSSTGMPGSPGLVNSMAWVRTSSLLVALTPPCSLEWEWDATATVPDQAYHSLRHDLVSDSGACRISRVVTACTSSSWPRPSKKQKKPEGILLSLII